MLVSGGQGRNEVRWRPGQEASLFFTKNEEKLRFFITKNEENLRANTLKGGAKKGARLASTQHHWSELLWKHNYKEIYISASNSCICEVR